MPPTAPGPELLVRPGVDVLCLDELDRLTTRPWFLRYAYSDRELGLAGALGPARRREFLAAHFAAKEAVVKALGHGFGRGLAPLHIEIDRRDDGRPEVRLIGPATAYAARVGAITVSISHKNGVAVAVALAHPRPE